MDVFEAIHNRFSQGKVRADPVQRAVIEKLLGAGSAGTQPLQGAAVAFCCTNGGGEE